MKIKMNWTQEKKDVIAKMIENWMHHYNIYNGELILQDDYDIHIRELLQIIIDDVIQPK